MTDQNDIVKKNEPQDSSASTAHDAGWERRLLEQLAYASIKEQKAARRWKLLFRLAWLVVIALFIWGLIYKSPVTPAPVGAHTAVVQIEGEIAVDNTANAQQIDEALRAAFQNADSKGVVLRINSPGGSPVQAGMINDEIRRLKKLYNKPIYAVVEESAASGAYYIAVAADKIYVNKASIVGSIGVLMDSFGFTDLMQKVGVERRLLTSGDHKGMLDPFSPLTPTDRAYAQGMLDQIHQQFIDAVKAGRGDRLKESPDTFSGLFWTGQQAIELGLADDYGSVDSVARDVLKAENTVDYTVRENVAERLAKRFGAAVGSGAVHEMANMSMQPR